MKHRHHDIFISAIHDNQKVQVVFYSKKDEMTVTRGVDMGSTIGFMQVTEPQ